MLVPMLDEAIELAADAGAHEVVIGMAHRGRLNVLAHIVGRPYEAILREFEGERTIEAVVVDREGGTRRRQVPPRRRGHARDARPARSRVTLASNPSHLEAVDPVVEGRARAEQTDRSTREGCHDPTRRAADPDPRRRVVRRPGRRRRDAQPRGPRRLLDRRHAAPDREQPGRLHDRSRRTAARRATRATSRRASTSRSSTSTPTTRRRRSPRSGSRSPTGAASATTSSSTSSATGATATTSRTRPRTRSR